MKTDPQTDKKMMGQGYQEHVVMPAQPTSGFVIDLPPKNRSKR